MYSVQSKTIKLGWAVGLRGGWMSIPREDILSYIAFSWALIMYAMSEDIIYDHDIGYMAFLSDNHWKSPILYVWHGSQEVIAILWCN